MNEEQKKIRELEREVQALRDQLEGDLPRATAWLQTKVWNQRVALDRLQKRVENQRFQLRTLNEMGRGLTRDEYLAARTVADPSGERIAAEPVTV